jgi:deoxycytidylate deaminase
LQPEVPPFDAPCVTCGSPCIISSASDSPKGPTGVLAVQDRPGSPSRSPALASSASHNTSLPPVTPDTVADPIPHGLPELFFAIVRAIGTDVTDLVRDLQAILDGALFRVHEIRISSHLATLRLPLTVRTETEFERYRSLMNAGDLLRASTGRGDAAALLAIAEISRQRPLLKQDVGAEPKRGRAYLIRSVMHPGEIATLRRVYGPQLFVIAAFSPRDARIASLSRRLAATSGRSTEECEPLAVRLINRDAGLIDREDPTVRELASRPEYLLNISKTFEKADLFVSAGAREDLRHQVERFISLIFGQPFITPSRDETGMALAQLASLRSSSLSRVVGASILRADGDVVALGMNEVPRFGGGQYGEGDSPDNRDFQLGHDSSDRIRRQLLSDLLRRICRDSFWSRIEGVRSDRAAEIQRGLQDLDPESVLTAALGSRAIYGARLMEVVEYGRVVHAEMAAITEAARKGVGVKDATLFCTTFPCHDCARHIVASGIRRVVYIEPYPKSRVAELFKDSIGLAERQSDLGDRVPFEPFTGVAPRRFQELFSWVKRKEDTPLLDSGPVEWSLARGVVRDSIVDPETVESGARELATVTMEKQFVEAFETRLADLRATQSGQSEIAGPR